MKLGYRIAEKASRSFVSARIRQSYVNKQRLRRESSEMRSRLAETLSDVDFKFMDELCCDRKEKMRQSVKHQHIRKLESLMQ